MIIGIVIGNVWATKKEDALNGLKLMVVQRIDPARLLYTSPCPRD